MDPIDASSDQGVVSEGSSSVRIQKCGANCTEIWISELDGALTCVSCCKCFHLQCAPFDKEVYLLMKKKGCIDDMHWRCKACRGDKVAGSANKPVTCTIATQTTTKLPIVTPKGPIPKEPVRELPSKDASKRSVEPVPVAERPPICSFYRKGRCRHGISGKKLVYEKECKFSHPKKCAKYCRYGNDRYQGCQGSCGFFHPMLCYNSIRYKRCNNRECTFQHLLGTELERSPTHSSLYSGRNGVQRMPPAGIGNKDSFQPPVHGWMRKESFGFNDRNPTHFKTSLDNKIEENSSAILSIQRCLEKLVKEIQNPVDLKKQETHPSFQNPWNNSSYAAHQFEAKNGNDPRFLKQME